MSSVFVRIDCKALPQRIIANIKMPLSFSRMRNFVIWRRAHTVVVVFTAFCSLCIEHQQIAHIYLIYHVSVGIVPIYPHFEHERTCQRQRLNTLTRKNLVIEYQQEFSPMHRVSTTLDSRKLVFYRVMRLFRVPIQCLSRF